MSQYIADLPIASAIRDFSRRSGVFSKLDLFSHEVVFHVGGNHLVSGDYCGRHHLLKYFVLTRELFGGTLQIEPECILSNERRAVLFSRVTAERRDRKLDVTMAEVVTIGPDGRFTEYWALADDQDQLDWFWS